jgi:hypothetical protein
MDGNHKGFAKRKAAFAKYKLPIELATAGVSPDRPLQVGREATHNLGDKAGGSGYGFALFGGKIMLCRGKPACPIRMHY